MDIDKRLIDYAIASGIYDSDDKQIPISPSNQKNIETINIVELKLREWEKRNIAKKMEEMTI